MRSLSSRKGISEILAALLVVCITVSAATLLAAYASGLMGSLQTKVTQPYTEQLTLEYYNWNTLTSLSVDFRNTGAATLNLQTADYYVGGIKMATPTVGTGGCTPSGQTWSALAPVGACPITVTISGLGTINSGIAYVLKIVLTDGATFTFFCIAGSNTH